MHIRFANGPARPVTPRHGPSFSAAARTFDKPWQIRHCSTRGPAPSRARAPASISLSVMARVQGWVRGVSAPCTGKPAATTASSAHPNDDCGGCDHVNVATTENIYSSHCSKVVQQLPSDQSSCICALQNCSFEKANEVAGPSPRVSVHVPRHHVDHRDHDLVSLLPRRIALRIIGLGCFI